MNTHTYISTYVSSVHIYIAMLTGIVVIFKYIRICVYIYVCVCLYACKISISCSSSIELLKCGKEMAEESECVLHHNILKQNVNILLYFKVFLQNSCSKNINNFSLTNVCFVHTRNSSDLDSEHNSFMFM